MKILFRKGGKLMSKTETIAASRLSAKEICVAGLMAA